MDFISILLLSYLPHLTSPLLLVKKQPVNDQNRLNCTLLPPVNEEVHLGWPHSLACDALNVQLRKVYYDSYNYDDYNYDYYGDYDDPGGKQYEIKCRITDLNNNEVVFSENGSSLDNLNMMSYNIYDVTEATSRDYVVEGSISVRNGCYAIHVHLNVTELPELTCEESVMLTNYTKHRRAYSNHIDLPCEVPANHRPEIHKRLLGNATATWFRNCAEISNATATGSRQWNGLFFPSVTFEHPGLYSCALTHNGMTRFINHYRFCVQPTDVVSTQTIKCTREVYHSNIGKNVIIQCQANADKSGRSSIHYTVTWNKKPLTNNSMECVNIKKGIEKSNINSRVSCSNNLDDQCFFQVPSAEERKLSSQTIVMQLIINNVTESDFGTYYVTLTSTFQNARPRNTTIVLKKNTIPRMVERATITGVCVAFVAIFILMIVVLFWKRIYVLVYWRRKFGKRLQDDKKFGAFLSYHFSRDMDKFAQQQTRDAVAVVRDELECLGYKLYDEYKDGCDVGLRAETSVDYMRQSHRVVVVLTSEYLKDHWNVFTIQKGVEEMITSDSKLIFILVPGIKEYLKQHSLKDDTYRMVQRALKLNYAIKWSDDSKFDVRYFSMLLELAMPKLESQSVSRHTSTSSSVGSQHVHYKNGFRRTLSNETRTTDLGSPVSTADEHFVEFVTESEQCNKNSAL